jgi:hypothetical protein
MYLLKRQEHRRKDSNRNRPLEELIGAREQPVSLTTIQTTGSIYKSKLKIWTILQPLTSKAWCENTTGSTLLPLLYKMRKGMRGKGSWHQELWTQGKGIEITHNKAMLEGWALFQRDLLHLKNKKTRKIRKFRARPIEETYQFLLNNNKIQ